jgi:hypothetical protein
MIRTKRVRILGVALEVTYAANDINRVSTTHAQDITDLLSQTTLDRIRMEVLGKPGTEEMIYEDLCTNRGPLQIPTPRGDRVNRGTVVRPFPEGGEA